MITKLKLPSRFLAVALCLLLSFADLPGTIAAAGGTPPIPVQASSGYSHSLLRFNDGSVWGWGYNEEGEAGHSPEQKAVTSPAKIQNLEDITEISAGAYHNLALKGDKTVWAWGYNGTGELGQVTSVTYNHIPTQVVGELNSGFSDITSIAAGADHSLALKQDGTVWAWGSNELGQLGQTVDPQNPATTMISVPVKLKVKDGNNQDVDFDQVIAIAAGIYFSVALKADGTVWGWGRNLGNSVANGAGGSTPVRIDGLNDIVQISAGNGFILALDAGGNVWGWGNNANNQLGINSTTAWISTPTKVKNESGTGFLSNIKAVSTLSEGANASYALSNDGTVYSFGLNTAGRLGDGTTTQRNLPVKVVGISNIVAIGPGLQHGLAIGGDGKIYTWGNNAHGQLGNGSTINRTTALKGSSILSSITLNTSTLQLKIGEPAAQLTPTIELNNPLTSGTIEWSSSDETVATVDTSGLVTAKGPGTATIKAAASDNSSINAASQVTVLDNNAGVAALNLSGINITPSVSADVYTATVPYAVTSTTVTATAASSKATVSALKLNDNPVTNPVGLSVGSNVITVEITAEDGTVKPYRVTVTRQPKSNNAGIGTLSLSGIVMSPTVSASVYDYTATVANSIDSTMITATAAHPFAAVTALKLNGNPVTNSIGLSVGSNVITVEVTAEDGTVQPYQVTVTRLGSSVTSLGNMSISEGSISPAFENTTYAYTADVPFSTTSITVGASVYDAHASFQLTTPKGQQPTFSLDVGNNLVIFKVTAEDGQSTATYTLQIRRAGSSNADLNHLVLSDGSLEPNFTAGTTAYNGSVSNSTAAITVTGIASDSNASMMINGASVPSGQQSQPLALQVGDNEVTIRVTAQDGSTVKTYTVRIHRAASSNADLQELTLSEGTLNPLFTAAGTAYNASVADKTASVTVTGTVYDANALLTVNGSPVASGQPSQPIALTVGDNMITIQVKAQDGTTVKTYSVNINRPAESPQVPAPGAPILDRATPGNRQIRLSWSPVIGSTGYKVFKSTTSGAYGLEEASVSDSVYSYDVTGLTNGTLYYFVVKATNLGGDSVASNEVSATSRAVSGRGSAPEQTPVPPQQTPIPPEQTPVSPQPKVGAFISSIVNEANLVNTIESKVAEAKEANTTIDFADTQGHWAKKTIDAFIKLQLINGYEDGTFRPDSPITRAEFAVILNRGFNIQGGSNTSIVLKDNGDNWAKGAIENLVAAGVIKGYDDGTFKPDKTITREEMVVMLSR
ncbi:cadherin-like beta sandwich domain-containing protein, partial [Paenibacillus rigui]